MIFECEIQVGNQLTFGVHLLHITLVLFLCQGSFLFIRVVFAVEKGDEGDDVADGEKICQRDCYRASHYC